MNKYKRFKKKIKDRYPGVFLLLYVLKRVIRKDDEYIQRVLAFRKDAEYLKIRHNGNKDYSKIVYVIKENSGHDGFCASVLFIIYYLIYAEQHGFAPRIRLTKNFTYYDKEKNKEISNPWEYYFVQGEPFYNERAAMNVSYASYYHMQEIRERYDMSAYKAENYYDERIYRLCSPIIKKHLRLKPEIINESVDLIKSAGKAEGRILGVHFRGTDYKKGYSDHPVFVNEKQIIAEINRAMETMRFTAVFLATDDASIGEKVRDSIGEIPLLQHPDVFLSDGEESVAFSESGRSCHHYRLGYEIARDMYTLSLCDGLVAGKSSVSFLSNLYKHSRNETYEYMCIIDNGNNSNDRLFVKPTGEIGYDK